MSEVKQEKKEPFKPLRNLHSVEILAAATRGDLRYKFELLTICIKDCLGSIHGCQYVGRMGDLFEMAVYYDIPGQKLEKFKKDYAGIEVRLAD